jgi:hypothetical protein
MKAGCKTAPLKAISLVLIAAGLLAGCVYEAPPPPRYAYYGPGYYYAPPPVYGSVYVGGRWR